MNTLLENWNSDHRKFLMLLINIILTIIIVVNLFRLRANYRKLSNRNINQERLIIAKDKVIQSYSININASKSLSRYTANILNESNIVAYYNGKIYNTFKHSMAQGTTVLVQEGTKRINKKAELGLTFGNAFISLESLANQVKSKQSEISKGNYEGLFNFTFKQNKENFVIAMA